MRNPLNGASDAESEDGRGSATDRKHETFRMTKLEGDTFEAALELDASDATEWRRLE
jgi:hypothetical protein